MYTTFSPRVILNTVVQMMSECDSTEEVRDIFLKMKMLNDLDSIRHLHGVSCTPLDVMQMLVGNNVIDGKDINYHRGTSKQGQAPYLSVKLSPLCIIHIENRGPYLSITINGRNSNNSQLRYNNAADIANWLMRQKKYISGYLEEWETILPIAAKKTKGKRMAEQFIKATFIDAMKDYTNLQYKMQVQQRKMRISVRIPGCNLLVPIDAWWGSYRQRLPEQIQALKQLIELHSTCPIKHFLTCK